MTMTVEYQKIKITGVESIVVSDIEEDDGGLVYARLIQIFVDPATDTTRRPVLELLLEGGDQTAGDKAALEITTPALAY